MSNETTEQPVNEAGGEDDQPSRIAGGCVMAILAGVALLLLKAVITVAPYTAYFVAGVLVCLAWQKAEAWLRKRRGEPAEGEQEEAKPDVAEALRRLIGDDKGVLLTRLRDDLKLPDTKAVKSLLNEAGIPWKPSRTREGNGPAVRKEAIPPAPSPTVGDAHGDGCCRSGDNGNDNNGGGEEGGKGVRVKRTNGGLIIYDLADEHRHHRVT